MKLETSAFYSDRLKLNLRDVLWLLIGGTVGRGTSLLIRLWNTPKMGVEIEMKWTKKLILKWRMRRAFKRTVFHPPIRFKKREPVTLDCEEV